MFNTVLWGTGEIYNTHLNGIRYFELTRQIKVAGILSEDISDKQSILDGYPVLDKNQIYWEDIDLIIVMSQRYLEEIISEIKRIAVDRIRVISFRAIEIPDINIAEYIRLVDKKISIISNNCWGGLVYRTLGIECRSPFKNLFLKDYDYLKVISDLERYMCCEPEFVRFGIDMHSKEKYPVLKILDVEIHCNHTKNVKTAVAEWNRRRKKLNLDNIFFEMYTENKNVADQFISITESKKRICFFPKIRSTDKDEKGMIYVDLQTEKKELWEAVNEYASLRNTKLNLVHLLLENKVLERRKRIDGK